MAQIDLFGNELNQCLFCRILSGKVSHQAVHEDADTLVFLDHKPLFPGHCLIVPKTHYGGIEEVPPELVGRLFTTAQVLARAVTETMAAEGTFIAVNNRVSQSVPHMHIHVVPRKQGDGLKGFFWPRQKYASDEAMSQVAARIRRTIETMGAQRAPLKV